MTTQEFIRMETEAIKILNAKDPGIIWEAVECGALEHVRLFAESRNYNITTKEIVRILWIDLCIYKRFEAQCRQAS